MKTGKVGQSAPWLEAGTNSLAGQIWSDAHLVPAGILLDVCTLRCQGSNALQMNRDGSGCDSLPFFGRKTLEFVASWLHLWFLDSTRSTGFCICWMDFRGCLPLHDTAFRMDFDGWILASVGCYGCHWHPAVNAKLPVDCHFDGEVPREKPMLLTLLQGSSPKLDIIWKIRKCGTSPKKFDGKSMCITVITQDSSVFFPPSRLVIQSNFQLTSICRLAQKPPGHVSKWPACDNIMSYAVGMQ